MNPSPQRACREAISNRKPAPTYPEPVMEESQNQPIVMFAGGGTGGHIYPNLAIHERLCESGFAARHEFVTSNREVDRTVMEKADDGITVRVLPIRPFSSRPWHWPAFLRAWNGSMRMLRSWQHQRGRVAALVTTGGFVSGPAIAFAAKQGIPTAMVNLDAVPGLANRKMSRHVSNVFSVYPHATLPGAQMVGLPLRRSAVGPASQAEARQAMGLEPDRPTLLITGGSQGAESVNGGVKCWVAQQAVRGVLQDWQVLHICGNEKQEDLEATYGDLHIPACVMPFCHTMGNAWRSATLAISRSGAGSVAEAWANATPTVFLPFPHHKDNHQKLNAGPIGDTGGTLLLTDLIDPDANAEQLTAQALPLMQQPSRLADMSERLNASKPGDGADTLARWILEQVQR